MARPAPRAALIIAGRPCCSSPAGTGIPSRIGAPGRREARSGPAPRRRPAGGKGEGRPFRPEQQTVRHHRVWLGPAAARKVEVSQPLVREVSDNETFQGRVEAAQTMNAGRVSETLAKVYLQAQQAVEKGRPLFEIDPRPYRLEMEKAEAELSDRRPS